MTGLETLQTIAAPTNGIGAYFYFHPATVAAGKELGLDGFRFYILGRGGALGDVSPRIVRSGFGYWNLPLIEKMWNSGRTTVSPTVAAQAYWDECGARGREALGDIEESVLAAYVDAADAVINAQQPGALALFVGTAELTCAEDTAAAAMQKAAVLRELRGSAHLCAVLAAGLDEAAVHCHRRPDMIEAFGYTEAPECPDDIDDRLAVAEQMTDTILEPAFSTLTDAQAAALVAGTEAISAAIAP